MSAPAVLIDRDAIAARVAEMAAAINRDYAGKEPALVVVLSGSFVFAADLIRELDVPVTVDFLGVRSYGAGSSSSGVVRITHDLARPIEGRDVIVVEDIVDTGLTVQFLFETLGARSPNSIALASLLHKPARGRVQVDIDYLGFTVEDVFVVGYGLDYDQRHRNLPYLGVLQDLPDGGDDRGRADDSN